MKESQVSVIIPTLEGDPLTLESVPDGVETVVVSEGNRSEARNIGVERSSGNILVFCDDDIAFEESFFWEQIEQHSRETVAGLEDFDFGLLLTRFLIVHRADFEQLGGFDENLNHMEDTEFSLNALSNGFTIRTIDQNRVVHEEHKSVGQGTSAIIKGALVLCIRYPGYAPKILRNLLG